MDQLPGNKPIQQLKQQLRLRVTPIVCFCVSLVVLSTPSSAFTSCPTGVKLISYPFSKDCVSPGHFEITRDALSILISLGIQISPTAVERVATGAIEVDLRETGWVYVSDPQAPPNSSPKLVLFPLNGIYQSCHHFDHRTTLPTSTTGGGAGCPLSFIALTDGGAFLEGLEYAHQQQQLVIRLLQTAQCSNVGPALDALAAALHAIQDAYSHSNYADVLNVGIGTNGQAAFDALTANPPSHLGSLPPSLATLRMTLYDENPATMNGIRDYEDPQGSCNSMDPTNFCHKLWSKDFVGKNTESSYLFPAAAAAAVAASERFVNSIISAVGLTQWNTLVGNFGGAHQMSCGPQLPCASPAQVSVSGTISGGSCSVSKYSVQSITSGDPNDKVGSQGSGPELFVSGATPLNYGVFFGNEPTASAPAQSVTITDLLPKALDNLVTFTLGPINFGSQIITPSAGTTFSTTVDLRPNTNLLVAVNAGLDTQTGVVTWQFTSLDPSTNQPTTDPTLGFLPAGGNGSVFFTVVPKTTVGTGTAVQNQATVVFDRNAPINTPIWVNTLDNTAPASSVSSLPANEGTASFPVQWQGADVGSGIGTYTIYVSDSGEPFQAWLTNTELTNASYLGVAGHTYGFYSIATDLVGNVEAPKTTAEATTRVQASSTCLTDVSSQVTITRGGFSYSHATKSFVQTVSLTNNGASLTGISLVLDGLSVAATLNGSGGNTACAAPLGSPWISIPGTLATGQSISLTLAFSDPTQAGIQYSTRVLAGKGQQ